MSRRENLLSGAIGEPMRALRLVLRASPASSAFIRDLVYRLTREHGPRPGITWDRGLIELDCSFPNAWTDDIRAQLGRLLEAGLVLADPPQ